MPPKPKSAEKPTKKRVDKNGASQQSTTQKSDRVLRKDPKKKAFSDEGSETVPKRSAGRPKGRPKKAVVSDNGDEEVVLTTRESEDDFSDEIVNSSESQNHSSNAVADIERDRSESSSERDERGDVSDSDMGERIDKHVDAALTKYFRKRKSKKRDKKKRRRKEKVESSSSSETESTSSECDSDESSSADSSISRREKRKQKKRKRKEKRKERRKEKRGKQSEVPIIGQTESLSTVYTRGCKSPQNAIMEASSDESLNGGDINSDANTDEFIASLNSSRDYTSRSTPNVGQRRDRSDSPRNKRSRSERDRNQKDPRKDGSSEMDDRYREQADELVRDLHQNKAELAKPSGEVSQYMLASLVRDFKHFHLISHVDKELREKIGENDFTIDFRRLLPRSRSKIKYDTRLQVVHQEGSTFFVPAGDRETKDITNYRTWEVAFRVFMGIFNQYWPDRMQELLQYSQLIQTASLNHSWECVYNYDISFREIMSEQPNTHWGMISQHTWTMEMGDSGGRSVGSQLTMGETQQTQRAGQKSKNPCWRFNKGKCTFGERCEYDHRCSRCGRKGHGKVDCYQRLKQEKGKEFKKEKPTKY